MRRIMISNYTRVEQPGLLQVNQKVELFHSAFQDKQPDVLHVPRRMWETQRNQR